MLDELTALSYAQGAHYARFMYALVKARYGIPVSQDQVPAAIRAQAAKDMMPLLLNLRDQLVTNAKSHAELSVTYPLVQAMKTIGNSNPRASSGDRSASDASCDLLRQTLPSARSSVTTQV